MKIDSAAIRTQREKRAWSQEHLAEVSGLGLRTIQRIETSGFASFDSVKAIAAAFGMLAADFTVERTTAAPAQEAPLVAEAPLPAKTSAEWQRRPAWVRLLFVGSSTVRMDRPQLERLQRVETVVASLLLILSLPALFELGFPPGAAMPLMFLSMVLYAAAYLASIHIGIGDRFGVWPWVQAKP